jgi:hypothetical protein
VWLTRGRCVWSTVLDHPRLALSAMSTGWPTTPRETHQAISRGTLIAAACFIVYVIAGGAIATQLVAGSSGMHVSDSHAPTNQTDDTTRDDTPNAERFSQVGVVVGITVEPPADCSLYCEPFNVHCTTTKDLISSDWIFVSAAEFDQFCDDLGCYSATSESPGAS